MPLTLMPTLSRGDIETIHTKSLDLLARVGTDYQTPKALDILDAAGCEVNYENTQAKIPPELVEWALEQAPRVVRLGARDPKRDVILDGRRSHHTTDSQGTQAIDLETGEQHISTLEDLNRGLLFADAMHMLEIVNIMIAAQDVPSHVRTIRHFAQGFTQTSKHIRTGVLHAGQVPFLVELVKAATGEKDFRPIFSVVDCTVSPLLHDGPMTEACIELAKLNVPIMIYPMPLAGGTSPVTPAGTMLLNNVEFLSALVLFQLVNPGTPIIYGVGSSQMDMKTGRYGGSANGQTGRIASAELARYYNLPFNLPGLPTSAKAIDIHYGFEGIRDYLLALLLGADEIYSMGLLGTDQILSLDKMVLDNHFAHQMDITLKPILIDEEHLQADLIEKVGIGGNFLGEPVTRALTHSEYVPVWPSPDQPLLDMVHEQALDILHNHTPPPLPEGAPGKIEAIVEQADKALA